MEETGRNSYFPVSSGRPGRNAFLPEETQPWLNIQTFSFKNFQNIIFNSCRLFGTKPLSAAMLTYFYSWEQIAVKFESKYNNCIHGNVFENVIRKMANILSRCVKTLLFMSQCDNIFGITGKVSPIIYSQYKHNRIPLWPENWLWLSPSGGTGARLTKT